MPIPAIGDTITTAWARELCQHFGITYLVDRIDTEPDNLKTAHNSEAKIGRFLKLLKSAMSIWLKNSQPEPKTIGNSGLRITRTLQITLGSGFSMELPCFQMIWLRNISTFLI